jgi:DNA-directed RNA polymerase subunit RPC12/RpoP
MIFKCPHCSKSLDAQDELAGLETQCPRCHLKILIPAPQPSIPDEPTRLAAEEVHPPAPPEMPPATEPSHFAENATPSTPFLPPKTSGMAVTSMILGIIGLFPGLICGGFVLSILAVILGHVAYTKISRNPQTLTGKGMAIAGFTTGYVGVAIGFIIILLLGAIASSLAAVMATISKAFPHLPFN